MIIAFVFLYLLIGMVVIYVDIEYIRQISFEVAYFQVSEKEGFVKLEELTHYRKVYEFVAKLFYIFMWPVIIFREVVFRYARVRQKSN